MRKRIGIVGGGASGVLAAIHCHEEIGDEAEILIFDPSPQGALGGGKAYGTRESEYLLNVPAMKMSAYPDRASSFVEWLRAKNPAIEEARHWPFVSRLHYGD